MSNIKTIVIVIVILAALILLSASLYTVDQREQVVITQFGEPVRVVKDPGLHIKTPFIQHLRTFEKRVLEWDGRATQIPTKDKKFILVDTYARWRIIEPLKFFQSVGDEMGAQTRLDNVIDATVRDFITEQNLIEVVRNSNQPLVQSEGEEIEREDMVIEMGRAKITRLMLERASEMTPQYGIELVDVEIKHINYVQSVRKKVFGDSERPRLSVFRSLRHIYAQIIDDDNAVTVVAAGTLNKEYADQDQNGATVKAAAQVGEDLARKALALGIRQVRFDRNGYKFHGRVRALADAARKSGLVF